jgi:hypothetical protein
VCWPFGSVTVTLANVPAGKSVIVTRSAVGVATVTVALPDFVASCVDVAITVALPAVAGEKTPALLIAPILVGLTDQVTDVLKLPVPVTVGVQDEVCVVRMEAGEQATDTEVIVGWAVTVTGAEPDFVESSVDVAVIVAVPAAEGVNTPPDEIVPSVAAHVTAEL